MDGAMDAARIHLYQLGHWCEQFKEYLDEQEPELNEEQTFELFKNIEAFGTVLLDTVNKFPEYPHREAMEQDIREYKNAIPSFSTPNVSQTDSQTKITEINSQFSQSSLKDDEPIKTETGVKAEPLPEEPEHKPVRKIIKPKDCDSNDEESEEEMDFTGMGDEEIMEAILKKSQRTAAKEERRRISQSQAITQKTESKQEFHKTVPKQEFSSPQKISTNKPKMSVPQNDSKESILIESSDDDEPKVARSSQRNKSRVKYIISSDEDDEPNSRPNSNPSGVGSDAGDFNLEFGDGFDSEDDDFEDQVAQMNANKTKPESPHESHFYQEEPSNANFYQEEPNFNDSWDGDDDIIQQLEKVISTMCSPG